jgi:hypothetical protein
VTIPLLNSVGGDQVEAVRLGEAVEQPGAVAGDVGMHVEPELVDHIELLNDAPCRTNLFDDYRPKPRRIRMRHPILPDFGSPKSRNTSP